MDRDAKKNLHDVHFVHSSEEQGMDIAVGHLHECGCKRIGSIIHSSPGIGNADAHAAIVKALESRALLADDSLIYFSGPGTEKYVELIGKLLKQGVDSLFCPGGERRDRLALRFLAL